MMQRHAHVFVGAPNTQNHVRPPEAERMPNDAAFRCLAPGTARTTMSEPIGRSSAALLRQAHPACA